MSAGPLPLPLLLLLLAAVVHGARVRLASGVDVEDRDSGVTPAFAYWLPTANDTASPATVATLTAVKAEGYGGAGSNGFYYDATLPQPAGSVPLVTFYSSAMSDYLTTSSPEV